MPRKETIYRVALTIQATLFLLGFLSAPCHADDRLQETFQRINTERKQHDLPTLKYNGKLATAAQSQSDWMAKVAFHDDFLSALDGGLEPGRRWGPR